MSPQREGPRHTGWGAPLTIGSLALGTVLLSAFVTAERRVSHPLLPLRVILDRTRGSSYAAIGVTGVAVFGVFLFLTYYMQQVKGYSPVTTGLLFLPMVGGILVASTISSVVLLPRVGSRVLIAAGLPLSGGGTAYLGQLTVTSGYPGHILPALLAMGLGFGMIFAPAANTATAGVPTNDSGVASALVNTMQQVGGSIGVSILSTMAASATASYLLAHHTGTQAAATAFHPRIHPGIHNLCRASRARRASRGPHAAVPPQVQGPKQRGHHPRLRTARNGRSRRAARAAAAKVMPRMQQGCNKLSEDTVVDDTARDRAIYQALKATDEVAAVLQTHLIEEHGADPERTAPQSPSSNSFKLLRQARQRLGEGLRALGQTASPSPTRSPCVTSAPPQEPAPSRHAADRRQSPGTADCESTGQGNVTGIRSG